jgi:hypothetical protein
MATNVTPAPDSTSLSEALSQAREAEGTASATGGNGEAGSAVAAATPGKTPETFLENVTADELAEIEADPVRSKAHKLMLRDYKAKTTAVAQRQKEYDDKEAALTAKGQEYDKAVRLYDAFKDDPQGALRAIAARYNVKLADPTPATPPGPDPELVELFGDEAAAAQPHMQKLIDKRVEERLKPYEAQLQGISDREAKREVAGVLNDFASELKDKGEEITPEIDAEMDRMNKLIDPAPGTSTRQFVEFLYALATSGKSKTEITKAVVERMTKAANAADPRDLSTAHASSSPNITDDMSLRDSLRAVREHSQRSGR